MDDVKRALGTRYKAQDCLGNRALSISAARAYFNLYRCATDEEKARCHNGGPSAKRKGTAMYAATTIYWNKVRKLL